MYGMIPKTMHIDKEGENTPRAIRLSMLDVEFDNRSVREDAVNRDGFNLFPQPIIGDEFDPLNWSFIQKHTILSIVMALYAFSFSGSLLSQVSQINVSRAAI